MDPSLETTADALLFIAQTFFLPAKPEGPGAAKFKNVQINSMNKHVNRYHPWVELNRSLAALSTLNATTNNVFAIMLQVFPEGNPLDKNDDLLDKSSIKSARFICADNWDEDESGKLRLYVSGCLEKLFAASEKVQGSITPGSEFDDSINDFIVHVYSNSWEKFRERMTKTSNRAERLVHALEESRGRKQKLRPPTRLRNLIDAIKNVLNILNTKQEVERDYVSFHKACTCVREEAFLQRETKDWLSSWAKFDPWTKERVTPFHILQKMLKTRNAIETLVALLKNPAMEPTFQSFAQAESRTIWVPSGPKSSRDTPFVVDLSLSNKYEIQRTYTEALSTANDREKQKYADGEQMWKRIAANVVNVKLPPKHNKVVGCPTKFEVDGDRRQHCEGKLLRYVIESGLLGKVFPYIGCSKLCCEPCFTAIAAVNELIDNAKMPMGDRLHFATDGTHRKIYSGFGLTLIENQNLGTSAFVKTFNKLLSRDIGLVAKGDWEKWSGGSDSDP